MEGDVVGTLRKLWRQSQVAAGVSVAVSRGMAAELCAAAATREVKVDRRVSSHLCQQCSTLLLPGLNCTVRLAARKNKQRGERTSRLATVRIHCHACDRTSERLGRARKDRRRARSDCKERLAEERRAAAKQRAREEGERRPALPKRSVHSPRREAEPGEKRPSTVSKGRNAMHGEKSARGKASQGDHVKKSTRAEPKIVKKRMKKKGGSTSLQKMLSQARNRQEAQEEEDYSLGSFLKSL